MYYYSSLRGDFDFLLWIYVPGTALIFSVQKTNKQTKQVNIDFKESDEFS